MEEVKDCAGAYVRFAAASKSWLFWTHRKLCRLLHRLIYFKPHGLFVQVALQKLKETSGRTPRGVCTCHGTRECKDGW